MNAAYDNQGNPKNIRIWKGEHFAQWSVTYRVYFENMPESYRGKFYAFFATEQSEYRTTEIKAQLISYGCGGLEHERRVDFKDVPKKFKDFILSYYEEVFGESSEEKVCKECRYCVFVDNRFYFCSTHKVLVGSSDKCGYFEGK